MQSNIKRIIATCLIVASCNSKVADKQVNQQAILLHNSMLKKADIIEHQLNELKADASIHEDSIKMFTSLLEQWKADLIEVPGNDNHTHHGHVHGHEEAPDVTEEQMLEIQKEFDARLSTIGKRISKLKPETNNDQHKH